MKFLFNALVAAFVLVATPAAAQEPYPSRIVTFIGTHAVGSEVDATARTLADALTAHSDIKVVVQPKNTGVGRAAIEYMMNEAKPDGYTFLFSSTGPMIGLPPATKVPMFSTLDDFVPICRVGYLVPLIVVVPSSSSMKSFADLVEYAKAAKQETRYAGMSIFAELNARQIAAQGHFSAILARPTRLAPESEIMGDLRRGDLEWGVTSVNADVREGVLRVLAVLDTARFSMFPDVPTITEVMPSVIPARTWTGLFARRGTPPERIEKVEAACLEVLKAGDLRKHPNLTLEPVGSQAFGEEVKTMGDYWTPRIREFNGFDK